MSKSLSRLDHRGDPGHDASALDVLYFAALDQREL